MFVPLSADRQSFDFFGAEHFRIARYASILDFSGDPRSINATLAWQKYPSSDTTRRWFIMERPSPMGVPDDISIDLDVTRRNRPP